MTVTTETKSEENKIRSLQVFDSSLLAKWLQRFKHILQMQFV